MNQAQKGFTLIEILLAVSAIAILAGIIILALNPPVQLGETRNAQRSSDINIIMNAAYQYARDNNGTLPASIPEDSDCAGTAINEICTTGAASCTGLVDLSVLTLNETYLVSLPLDPQGSGANTAGYHIAKSSNGRLTVCAPDAERSATISATR
ncbi:MAG: prepilin-type N-terminal cleavage/methylation domain-containing protein [bacterium]|nr:prepilin-type N-terminal cleavage/methylation domain-containing protein [bacterium]MDA1024582.1 prepilin-type N-terminal cleavage/methylation domain-containing protein [bacterium]